MTEWKKTLDLSDFWAASEYSFEQKRDLIVSRIRALDWDTPRVQELLEELAEVQGLPEFDAVFGEIHDQADIDRVWIETH